MHNSLMQLACFLGLLAGAASGAYADPKPEKISIVTWNLEWFFDAATGDNFTDLARKESAPSEAEWQWKLEAVAGAIAKMNPTVLALQEVENGRVLWLLTKMLKEKHGLVYRYAMVEGHDHFTEQDVGILYQSGLVESGRREQTQEMWQSKEYYDLQKHIIARFQWGEGEKARRLLMVNVHLKAMQDGEPIRKRQGKLLRTFIDDAVKRGESVVVIGDMNSNDLYAETKPESDIGIIRGLNTSDTDDDLVDLHQFIPPEKQATHIIAKQFDRILVTPNMTAGKGKVSGDFSCEKVEVRADLNTRGKEQDKDHWGLYWKIPQEERDISDHFPVIATFVVK